MRHHHVHSWPLSFQVLTHGRAGMEPRHPWVLEPSTDTCSSCAVIGGGVVQVHGTLRSPWTGRRLTLDVDYYVAAVTFQDYGRRCEINGTSPASCARTLHASWILIPSGPSCSFNADCSPRSHKQVIPPSAGQRRAPRGQVVSRKPPYVSTTAPVSSIACPMSCTCMTWPRSRGAVAHLSTSPSGPLASRFNYELLDGPPPPRLFSTLPCAAPIHASCSSTSRCNRSRPHFRTSDRTSQ